MVRSLWAGALAGVFACAAGSWAQPPVKTQTKPTAAAERVITVNEPGKPAQKCRVLRCWAQQDGSRVCEVQDLATGEKMTILENMPGTSKKSLAQIFRWGKSSSAPAGVPAAPGDAVTVAAPAQPSLLSRSLGSKKTTTVASGPVTTSDPRESWGKVERWTADDSEKAVQTASARAEVVSPRRPVAAKQSHDPLLHPGHVSPVVTESKPAARPNLLARLRGGRTPAPKSAPVEMAPGMGSVMAANSPRMARELDTVMTVDKDGAPVLMSRGDARPNMVAVDVTAPNAFSAPMPVRMPAQAPAHLPLPPMPMPGGGTMMAGMSMAPAYPPGMMPAQPVMVMAPPVQPAHDAGAHTAQLVHQLHQGALPSERELAADQLARVNWKMEPAAVQALMHGAKADPAPMVRACCVQALAKMKANTVPVVQAVSACKQDGDARVRQAAEQALAELMGR